MGASPSDRYERLPIELRNTLGDMYPHILAVVFAELDVKPLGMNKIISQFPANALSFARHAEKERVQLLVIDLVDPAAEPNAIRRAHERP